MKTERLEVIVDDLMRSYMECNTKLFSNSISRLFKENSRHDREREPEKCNRDDCFAYVEGMIANCGLKNYYDKIACINSRFIKFFEMCKTKVGCIKNNCKNFDNTERRNCSLHSPRMFECINSKYELHYSDSSPENILSESEIAALAKAVSKDNVSIKTDDKSDGSLSQDEVDDLLLKVGGFGCEKEDCEYYDNEHNNNCNSLKGIECVNSGAYSKYVVSARCCIKEDCNNYNESKNFNCDFYSDKDRDECLDNSNKYYTRKSKN